MILSVMISFKDIFDFVVSSFVQKCIHMTVYTSVKLHTGGGNEGSVRKYLMKTSSDCH